MFYKQHFAVIAEEAKKINWNTSSIKSKREERSLSFTSHQTRKSEEFLNKQLFPLFSGAGNETNQFVFN